MAVNKGGSVRGRNCDNSYSTLVKNWIGYTIVTSTHILYLKPNNSLCPLSLVGLNFTVLFSGTRSISKSSISKSTRSRFARRVGLVRRSTGLSAFRQRRRPRINRRALQASDLLRERSSREWWKTTVVRQNHDYLKF